MGNIISRLVDDLSTDWALPVRCSFAHANDLAAMSNVAYRVPGRHALLVVLKLTLADEPAILAEISVFSVMLRV